MSSTVKILEYGARNLWDYHLTHEATVVQCNGLRSFLRYLCSKGTMRAILTSSSHTEKTITVKLEGPKCDDGFRIELDYLLERKHIHDEEPWGLNSEEKVLLSIALRDALSRSGKRNSYNVCVSLLALPKTL